MAQITPLSILTGRKVVCGGGGGSVTAALAASVGLTSATVFTTPASPADAEYLIELRTLVQAIGASAGPVVLSDVPAAAQASNMAAKVAAGATGDAVAAVNTILAGPGAAISVPIANASAQANTYMINYNYAAYRSVYP